MTKLELALDHVKALLVNINNDAVIINAKREAYTDTRMFLQKCVDEEAKETK